MKAYRGQQSEGIHLQIADGQNVPTFEALKERGEQALVKVANAAKDILALFGFATRQLGFLQKNIFLKAVIDEVNRIVAADRGLHLELLRWETDTHPGFHTEGPQGLLGPILYITDCDPLIGIFWKHFGTPTVEGKTGTEHEFSLTYAAWKAKGSPQIFIYFNQPSYTPKSKAHIEQWRQVIDGKVKFPKEGLWCPYKGQAQFEKPARNHLIHYLRHL